MWRRHWKVKSRIARHCETSSQWSLHVWSALQGLSGVCSNDLDETEQKMILELKHMIMKESVLMSSRCCRPQSLRQCGERNPNKFPRGPVWNCSVPLFIYPFVSSLHFLSFSVVVVLCCVCLSEWCEFASQIFLFRRVILPPSRWTPLPRAVDASRWRWAATETSQVAETVMILHPACARKSHPLSSERTSGTCAEQLILTKRCHAEWPAKSVDQRICF